MDFSFRMMLHHGWNICLSVTVVIFSITIAGTDAATTPSPNNEYGLLCPHGFDLVRAGQCRGTAQAKLQWPWNTALNNTIDLCGALDALPLMIKSKEQNDYWNARVRSGSYMPLGIVCNMETKKWQWIDGSAIDYKPSHYDPEINSACVQNAVWAFYNAYSGYFKYGQQSSNTDFDFNCVSQIIAPVVGNDNCFDLDDPSAPCYKMSETTANWADAQKQCALIGASIASVHSSQENSFIRRLAVSNGYTDGLFLGASISGKADNFGWVDGTDWDYTNFHSGFPVPGYGDCLVMDTHDTAGAWINTECAETHPFVCSRKAFADSNTTCLGTNTKEGDMIFTPGFPTNASIPCELFLKVDSGKQVEVEIVLLEANSCCDKLVLFEGSFGDEFMAELTGSMSGVKYRTVTSNIMRVSWEPQGGVNVRGAIITFNAV